MSTRTVAVLAALVLTGAVAACGGDEGETGSNTGDRASESPPASTTQSTAAPKGDLTIRMSEFAFDPKDATAAAGKVTIVAPNDGKVVHELVLLRTDADPANLPKKGDEVDESTAVGEIDDVEAGATKTGNFELEPGKYAMVCALPGHYERGMYGSLTVK